MRLALKIGGEEKFINKTPNITFGPTNKLISSIKLVSLVE